MQPAQRAFVVGVGARLRPQISYPSCCAHLSLGPCSHICWALLPYILLRWGFAPAPLSLRLCFLSWALVPRAMCISIGVYFLRAFRGRHCQMSEWLVATIAICMNCTLQVARPRKGKRTLTCYCRDGVHPLSANWHAFGSLPTIMQGPSEAFLKSSNGVCM